MYSFSSTSSYSSSLSLLPTPSLFFLFSLVLGSGLVEWVLSSTLLRGAVDCYERICGNPRSNLHADGNGCVSSLIRWVLSTVYNPTRLPAM